MEASLTGLRDLMRRGNRLEAVKGCRKGQVSTNSDQLHPFVIRLNGGLGPWTSLPFGSS